MEKFDKKVKDLLETYVKEGKANNKLMNDLKKSKGEEEFWFSYFKQIADDKKEGVLKRIELLNETFKEQLSFDLFKKIWPKALEFFSLHADFPFAAAALGKILSLLQKEYKITIKEFF